MKIKDVARISFTARRSAKQKGNLAISPSVFRKVVIDHQNILAFIHKIFTNGTTAVRGEILESGGFGSGSGNNNRITHRSGFFQFLNDLGDFGFFLADSDVNTNWRRKAFVFSLVDYSIDSDCGFTGLAVADNEFALTSADWNHTIDSFPAGVNRHFNSFAGNDARSDFFKRVARDSFLRKSRTPVFWITKRVNDSSDKFFGNGNRKNRACTFYRLAFFDERSIA